MIDGPDEADSVEHFSNFEDKTAIETAHQAGCRIAYETVAQGTALKASGKLKTQRYQNRLSEHISKHSAFLSKHCE